MNLFATRSATPCMTTSLLTSSTRASTMRSSLSYQRTEMPITKVRYDVMCWSVCLSVRPFSKVCYTHVCKIYWVEHCVAVMELVRSTCRSANGFCGLWKCRSTFWEGELGRDSLQTCGWGFCIIMWLLWLSVVSIEKATLSRLLRSHISRLSRDGNAL